MLRQREDESAGRAGAPTVIGRGLTVTGDLTTDEPIEIRGRVDGTVIAPHVAVAPGGRIDGAVIARTVEIGGAVGGKAEAFSVSIRSGAEVMGSIIHHEIEVERGAKIDGPMPWRPKGYFDDAPPPLGSGKGDAKANRGGEPRSGRDGAPRR